MSLGDDEGGTLFELREDLIQIILSPYLGGGEARRLATATGQAN